MNLLIQTITIMAFNVIEIQTQKAPEDYLWSFLLWCRGTESNCRHGDFQTKISKVQKCCDYKKLILFRFFMVFLVWFGTVWKYLNLTGTIWAQSVLIMILILS